MTSLTASRPLTADDWFAMSALPAGRVRVRVRWNGREFRAAKVPNEKGRLVWATVDAGEVQYLPPKGKRALEAWGAEPERWQPENPESWTWPNGKAATPLPVRIQPQMISQAGRRKWDAMAEQAEQSARTQADLEADLGPEDELPEADDRAWWRDGARLTYCEPGPDRAGITVSEAEGRMLRAILTDGLKSATAPNGWEGAESVLSQMAASGGEAVVAAWSPTRRDISDHPVAMAWFAALWPVEMRPKGWEPYDALGRVRLGPQQDLLVMGAIGKTWTSMGKKLNCSDVQARRLYAGALVNLHRAANGLQVFEWVKTKDQMAALRERNRAAKRGNAA